MSEVFRNQLDPEIRDGERSYLSLSFLALTDTRTAQAQQFHGDGPREQAGAFGRLSRRQAQLGSVDLPIAPPEEGWHDLDDERNRPYAPSNLDNPPNDTYDPYHPYRPRTRPYGPHDRYGPSLSPDLNEPGFRLHRRYPQDAIPTPPGSYGGNEDRAPWQVPLPPYRVPPEPTDLTIIPTLRIGEQGNQQDATVYRRDDERALLFDRAKPAIVLLKVEKEKGNSSGSGFFVSPDGQIVTADHVVDSARDITVQTADGRQFKASVVERRPTVDAAVLQLEGANGERFSSLPLAAGTRDLRADKPLMVVGHPHGWEATFMSPGKFATRGSLSNYYTWTHSNNPNQMMIEANIHIERGNSGSPLLNQNGEVVGLLNFGTASEKAHFSVVEDIRPLVRGEDGKKLGDPRPALPAASALQFEGRALKHMAAAAMATRTMVGPGGLPSRAGRALVGAYALFEFSATDLPFLVSAMKHGTTAEKVSASIDAGSDLAMWTGMVAANVPRFRVIGSAVTLLGAAGKIGNHMLADRRTY